MGKVKLQSFLGPLPLDRFRRMETSGLQGPLAGVETAAEAGPISGFYKRTLTLKEKAAAYVCSPKIHKRIKIGAWSLARFYGRHGMYWTTCSASGRAGFCSCPAKTRPCKHMIALSQTAAKQPESFRGVSTLIEICQHLPQEQVSHLLQNIFQADPRLSFEAFCSAVMQPRHVDKHQLSLLVFDHDCMGAGG